MTVLLQAANDVTRNEVSRLMMMMMINILSPSTVATPLRWLAGVVVKASNL